jgi:hypothetical protein
MGRNYEEYSIRSRDIYTAINSLQGVKRTNKLLQSILAKNSDLTDAEICHEIIGFFIDHCTATPVWLDLCQVVKKDPKNQQICR